MRDYTATSNFDEPFLPGELEWVEKAAREGIDARGIYDRAASVTILRLIAALRKATA